MTMSIAGAALMLAALPPKDKVAPPPLVATAPWTVHAEENICALSRQFGTGDEQIVVGFQPIFTAPQMEVLVLSRSTSDRQQIGTAKLRFAPSGRELEASYFSLPGSNKGLRYTRITVASEAFALMQTSTEMSVKAPPVATVIAIPASAKAIATFRQCENDLLKSWGIDPATVTPERAAKPINPARFFGTDSYPPEALSKGFVGRVVALMQIDATGRPTACRIVSGVAAPLNDATCKGTMRVKFEPGVDAAGRPVPSIMVFPVRWQR